jgi:hypothetical protein
MNGRRINCNFSFLHRETRYIKITRKVNEKRSRISNKRLRDTKYAKRRCRGVSRASREISAKTSEERCTGGGVEGRGEGEGEKEGFDTSLSVDRKLKLPLGSNEISTHTHTHTHTALIIHMCICAPARVYVCTHCESRRKETRREKRFLISVFFRRRSIRRNAISEPPF